MSGENDAPLRWDELPAEVRVELAPKIRGLYAHAEEWDAFDVLAVDKQQALLIFAKRLRELELSAEVARITDVYGAGGVGMSFRAASDLAETLAYDVRFSSLFAAHGDTARGFFETGRTRAALHFLQTRADAARWSVHFDLHAPAATALSAFQHLWFEKWRKETPDWRAIKAALD